MIRAEPRDGLRRADDPAGAQTRKTERLRQSRRDQHLVVAAPERGRGRAGQLGPAVDLVRDDPGAGAAGGPHHRVHLLLRQDGAGRVVRVGHENQPGAARHGTLQAPRVQRPARAAGGAALGQAEGVGATAVGAGQPPGLQVVRDHHGGAVALLEQAPEADVVGLRPAVRHHDVVASGAAVELPDAVAQRFRTARGGVLQTGRTEPARIGRAVQQLLHPHRQDAALGQIVLHLVLVQTLRPFHLEQVDAHGSPRQGRPG